MPEADSPLAKNPVYLQNRLFLLKLAKILVWRARTAIFDEKRKKMYNLSINFRYGTGKNFSTFGF